MVLMLLLPRAAAQVGSGAIIVLQMRDESKGPFAGSDQNMLVTTVTLEKRIMDEHEREGNT